MPSSRYFGGHIMAMPSSKMHVSGVELNRMGQNLTLARYPIHWHLVGDGKGQYIRNAAIHDTYNRCVTVHGTNNLRVENNVTYNTVGHCFFIEDGIETRQPVRPQPRDPDQVSYDQAVRADQPRCRWRERMRSMIAWRESERPAIQGRAAALRQHGGEFWITQSEQHLPRQRGRRLRRQRLLDVAAGAPERPVRRHGDQQEHLAARTKLREFKGNVAHSNFDGFMFDRDISANNTFRRDRQLAYRPRESRRPEQPASRKASSRISPPTRTAMAASGAAVRCTCSGT